MYRTNKLRIITLIFGLLFMLKLNAQQQPQYSHYMYNQMAYNPGYAGSSPDIVVNILHREQWMSFDGQPRTSNGNISVPFNLFSKSHGAGFSVYTDALGFNSFTILDLSYAYKAKVGDGNLGIGVSAGLAQNKLTASENDWNPPVNTTGWTAPEKDATTSIFRSNVGLFYSTDELYLGLSATNVFAGEFEYANTTSGSVLLKEHFVPHYYLNAGYKFQLTNPAFELYPSVLITSDGQTSKYDVNTTLIYNNKVWGGLSYRVGTAVTGMAGFELMQNLKVGMAYDFGTTDFNQYAPSTIEIFVRYNFTLKVEKLPERYKSIRYL